MTFLDGLLIGCFAGAWVATIACIFFANSIARTLDNDAR